MATHSSILAWEIPWTEEPGGLQFKGSQKVGMTEWLNTHTLADMSAQERELQGQAHLDPNPASTIYKWSDLDVNISLQTLVAEKWVFWNSGMLKAADFFSGKSKK